MSPFRLRIIDIAILLGAEWDAELERGRQLQAGTPAERSFHVPPRETTRIEKARERRGKDLAETRRSHGEDEDRSAST